MNRNDIIELILDHAINQAVYSQSYLEFLQDLSDADLDFELDRLEQIALFGFCDMPRPTPPRPSIQDTALAKTLANPVLLPVLKRLADK